MENVASDATDEEPPTDPAPKRSGGPRKNKLTAAAFEEMARSTRALTQQLWASRKRQLLLAAMEDENLPRSAVRVLERLLDYANQERHGYAFVRVTTLALGKGPERKPLAERTAHNSLSALEEGRYIATQRQHKGTQRCSRYHFPPIASGIMPGDEGPGSDCKTDCNSDCNSDCAAMQSADCKVEQNQTATVVQSEREPISLNPSKDNQTTTRPAPSEPVADVGDVPRIDGQERPALSANPFEGDETLIPFSPVTNLLQQATAGVTNAEQIDGPRLPLSASLRVLGHDLCVDVEKTYTLFKIKSAGKVIRDPTRYVAKMMYEEAAKRDGVPIALLKKAVKGDHKSRAAAQAEAVGTRLPSRTAPAHSPAKSDARGLQAALAGWEASVKRGRGRS
ncbi:MAG: hypothetical protein NW223_23605 [Hyphomicrobiaceae bacterium]|nr:hypothetical protein [Hyphomicrobiaceae bacterium]